MDGAAVVCRPIDRSDWSSHANPPPSIDPSGRSVGPIRSPTGAGGEYAALVVEDDGRAEHGALRRRAQDTGCVISLTIYTAAFQVRMCVRVCACVGWCGFVVVWGGSRWGLGLWMWKSPPPPPSPRPDPRTHHTPSAHTQPTIFKKKPIDHTTRQVQQVPGQIVWTFVTTAGESEPVQGGYRVCVRNTCTCI